MHIPDVLHRLSQVRRCGDGWTARCPEHEDRKPSLSINEGENGRILVHCHAGCDFEAIARRLGFEPRDFAPPNERSPIQAHVAFSPADALKVWSAARARARDDECVEADREAYDYLASRQLLEAWEFSELGILGPGMDLAASIAHWVDEGYRVVSPLFDQGGYLANVQARAIRHRDPKTKFPPGSMARGTLFADARGRCLLKKGASASGLALLGEGLTDFLALLPSSPVPLFSAPGTGMAPAAIGPWVKDLTLFLALDRDRAGRSAVRPTAARAYEHGARSVLELSWPSGCKDACEYLEAVGRPAFEAFLRRIVGQVVDG